MKNEVLTFYILICEELVFLLDLWFFDVDLRKNSIYCKY